jgi:dTDP-glucose pyrophosphorylase
MCAIAFITKCVILSRGLGKRMRREDSAAHLDATQSAAADSGMKAMVPIGRPFLDYVLSALADAGFHRVCLVIGPEHGSILDYYTRLAPTTRIQVDFAVQAEPLGTANAVLAAEGFAGTDEFLVLNGDNYYPIEALHDAQQLGQPGTVLFDAESLVRHSNIPEDRVQAFATCVVDGDGFLADIVEKPESRQFDRRKLISMNCWRFAPTIFSACRDVPLSPRGEFELPLAVKFAIQHGLRFKTVVSQAGVLDLSRRSDIATVADRLKHVKVEP